MGVQSVYAGNEWHRMHTSQDSLPPLSITEALSLFTAQLEADGRSPHTIAQAARHAALLQHWLATEGRGEDIMDIGHAELAKFLSSDLARLKADGTARKASSLNVLRSSLRSFFSYLASTGLVPSDPTRVMRRAICSQAQPRGLTPDEERRLVWVLQNSDDTKSNRDRALFLTMLWGGLRVGSAVALEVEDVNCDAGELFLHRAKGGRTERVVMGSELNRELEEYLKRTKLMTGPLFPSRQGGELSTRHVARLLSDWLKRARIERHHSPHALRHTCATRLYERTGDPFLVKEALRHRSLSSTLRYVTCDESRLRAALS